MACLARRIYTPRLEIGLSIWRDGHAELSVINDDWAPLKAATVPVTLTLDQQPTVTIRGEVMQKVMIAIDLTRLEALRTGLKSGRQLRVRTEVGTMDFDLAGIAGALQAITDCTTQELSSAQ